MFNGASKVAIGAFLLAAAIFLMAVFTPVNAASKDTVVILEAEGTITIGMLAFFERQITKAEEEGAQLVVIKLNTPGGLVDATFKINETIINAGIPVAVYVAPSGAIAASAGAIILLASDIAAAAPGTTIGAAQPVVVSPDGTAPADDKTTSFLAEYLGTLADDKGRPADLAKKFVTENLTVSAREALEEGLIDYMPATVDQLLEELDGSEIVKNEQVYNLQTLDAAREVANMNLRERLQHWLSDPSIAFMLLILGVMGIYFGLSAPGTIVPEVTGAILLVMGIYGMGLFDTNTAGILLLLLGIGLIIAEIFTSGFGVLGIGGAICLITGAIMLPLEPLMAPEWYISFRFTVIGTVVALVLIIIVVAQRVLQSRRSWKEGSAYFNPPLKGVVVEDLSPWGMIRARGELWKACSDDGSKIETGTEVEVVRSEGLNLWVSPSEE